MNKDTLKFAFRMSLVQLAAAVMSFICLFMLYGSDIDSRYKSLAGIFFIGFTLFLIWNNAVTRGENDAKEKGTTYKPYKGFLSGALAMILPIIIAVYYIVINIHGYNNPDINTPTILYILLYIIFLPYTPVLTALSTVSPNLGVDFVQPAIVLRESFGANNAVLSYLYIIPIVVFIAATGVFYIYGYKKQEKLLNTVKVPKTKSDNII